MNLSLKQEQSDFLPHPVVTIVQYDDACETLHPCLSSFNHVSISRYLIMITLTIFTLTTRQHPRNPQELTHPVPSPGLRALSLEYTPSAVHQGQVDQGSDRNSETHTSSRVGRGVCPASQRTDPPPRTFRDRAVSGSFQTQVRTIHQKWHQPRN